MVITPLFLNIMKNKNIGFKANFIKLLFLLISRKLGPSKE
jgi:hypothetical protein